MNRKTIFLAIAFVMLLSVDLFAKDFKRGELIVEINPDASIAAVNARHRTSVRQRLYNTNFYLLTIPEGKKEKKWRKKLRKDPDVISADLNPVVTSPALFGRSIFEFPDGFAEPGYTAANFLSQQDLFNLLQLEEVNQRSSGRGATVAVIDTGVDTTHPDLIGKLWRDLRTGADLPGDNVDTDGDGLLDDFQGWDFVGNDNDPTEGWGDPDTTVAGHGTFIARIITLLAPGARVMPLRVSGPDGVADAFVVATAVKYATDHGAHVINLSLGSPEVSPLLQAAIEDARQHGVFVVAAVGNDNNETPQQYPASSEDVLAVASIDLTSKKSHFSNFGTHVDVCAPGSQLISAFPSLPPGQASFARWSGTSFAAPFASAEAALLLAVDPANPDVGTVIKGSALNIDALNPGLSGKLGKGRISPLEALIMINAPPANVESIDHLDSVELTRGAGIIEGKGSATIKISGQKQALLIEATGLPVTRKTYNVAVNGVVILGLTQTVNNLGSVRFVFATGTAFPPPVLPVSSTRRVEIRDSLGAVVFSGEFKADEVPVDAVTRAFKQARLFSPVNTTAAAGTATVRIDGLREELSIQAEGLGRGQVYTIRVDGNLLGSYAASATGLVGALFASDGVGGNLPPALRPVTRIRVVEILDRNNAIVRRGEFLAVTSVA
ncbi:MAG TPA: S8 family serine peptidase, partial [Blastocatellia bacterium]|nr:S8 family serine peptidase [Blastocatellia bacterium]